jgi:hypothetical protein
MILEISYSTFRYLSLLKTLQNDLAKALVSGKCADGAGFYLGQLVYPDENRVKKLHA